MPFIVSFASLILLPISSFILLLSTLMYIFTLYNFFPVFFLSPLVHTTIVIQADLCPVTPPTTCHYFHHHWWSSKLTLYLPPETDYQLVCGQAAFICHINTLDILCLFLMRTCIKKEKLRVILPQRPCLFVCQSLLRIVKYNSISLLLSN